MTGKTTLRLGLWLGLPVSALSAALIIPALAQESLLPEGFGKPPENPAPRPSPTPAPTSTPTPTRPPAAGSAAAPAQGVGGGSAAGSVSAGSSDPQVAGDAESAEDEADEEAVGAVKYDLPPGARRLLTRIGPLTPETGGMSPDAFGVRGKYVEAILLNTDAPIASRWTSILLRRALLSAIDTPKTINGADLAAARARLLLKMGEAQAARRLVQSVDPDRASPRLTIIAQQTYLANADPAGLCPFVPQGLRQSQDASWQMAAGICSGLTGEAGPAGSAIDRVRNSRKVSNFDILLAERVLGASINGRRSVTIQWDGVDRLTSWRFGLATATATPIPAALRSGAPGYMRGWAVMAPMTEMPDRIAAAPWAALRGILSNRAYVSLVSAADQAEEPTEALQAEADLLRRSFRASEAADRIAAMRQLWDGGRDADGRYAAMILTARAAASLPVQNDVGDNAVWLIGSMLAGGYDRNAMAWVPTVAVGSHAWGVLAVGSPRPLKAVTAAAVDDFADDDDSSGGLRSRFLLAGLAGLGRISADEANSAASSLDMTLGARTRWAKAIDEAAARGEPGLVALLAATGMQSGDWSKIPPAHLYHIVRALREVGLGSEARMIAAEALVRV